MGFSVSGSAAIVFVGAFIALGLLQPAVSNGMERVNDAQSADAERLLDQQNTAVVAVNATYDSNNDPSGTATVTVTATNEGTTSISLENVDFLLGNRYEDDVTTTIGGNGETEVWLPGEELTATLDVEGDGDPTATDSRVKLVVDHGISDAVEVS